MNDTLQNIKTVSKRELSGYFASPVAYVFIVIWLLLNGFFTFSLGGFFEMGQASLTMSFFRWHPWLYLFLVPAVGMRLWSEERRLHTLELLLTMPITPWQAIVGKFIASWLFLIIALALTFPVVITVCYLGDADVGEIFTGYVGSALLAGGYLAVTSMTSAMTRNQVVAFVLDCAICFLFTVSGTSIVLNFFSGWAPRLVVETVASFSFMTHFQAITRGVIDLKDVVFFGSLIALCLYANVVLVEWKKGG